MSRQLSFTDYEGFVEKFKPKKTTDDCYTPTAVYEAVLDYVNRNVTPLEGRDVVRPFWPGGDYERHEYPQGCIVIDNPPFSITAQIVRFYIRHGIDFFLFANGLTMFSYSQDILSKIAFHIIRGGVRFENRAVVNIGFLTNIHQRNEKIVLAGWLDEKIKQVQRKSKKQTHKLLAKPIYPDEVVTCGGLEKYIFGKQITITEDQCAPIASHEAPFGGGFMVTSQVAEELERERERLTERRPMSPAFHEMLRRLNASAPPFHIDP